MQALLAPCGDKIGLFNSLDRLFAQRLTASDRQIHTNKPLRSGAIDQGRFVAPAMHIAVVDALVLEQSTDFFELGDDGRIGLPDKLAAKEWQVSNVNTVALYWAENVVIGHAVLFTGAEVILTVSRCRMHHASTRIQLNVFSQIYWREAIIKWVAEIDHLQRCTRCSRQHLALQAIAGQAVSYQIFSQQQQALAGINQRVVEFGMYVQRLVSRNGPGRGRPDHDSRRFGQRG